jgi:transposase
MVDYVEVLILIAFGHNKVVIGMLSVCVMMISSKNLPLLIVVNGVCINKFLVFLCTLS